MPFGKHSHATQIPLYYAHSRNSIQYLFPFSVATQTGHLATRPRDIFPIKPHFHITSTSLVPFMANVSTWWPLVVNCCLMASVPLESHHLFEIRGHISMEAPFMVILGLQSEQSHGFLRIQLLHPVMYVSMPNGGSIFWAFMRNIIGRWVCRSYIINTPWYSSFPKYLYFLTF